MTQRRAGLVVSACCSDRGSQQPPCGSLHPREATVKLKMMGRAGIAHDDGEQRSCEVAFERSSAFDRFRLEVWTIVIKVDHLQ